MSTIKCNKGITLVELLVAIVISGIVIASLFGFFRSSNKRFNVQEQIDEMNQNAHFTIQRLYEDFSQTGADLPVGCDNVLDIVNKSSVKMWINQLGGIQKLTTGGSPTSIVYVDKPENFRAAKSIVREYPSGNSINYQVVDIESVSVALKYVRLKNSVKFEINDYIYAINTMHYYMAGKNLCLNTNDNILAENITDLSIHFKDSKGVLTTSWSQMQICSLSVTATTAIADPSFKAEADGKRKKTLTKVFSLKNTFYY